MEFLTTIEALEAQYGTPGTAAMRKVTDRLTPSYRAWMNASRLCMISTVGPEGTDGSPRGDEGPVVLELDERTLAMPDWHGNNRIDTLRNIVSDGRISLMFMVPGSNNVLRINGTAKVTADEGLRARFGREGKQPRTVVVIAIAEVYPQCARALMRARTWTSGDESAGLPSLGQMLADATAGDVGGEAYDRAWPERAKASLW